MSDSAADRNSTGGLEVSAEVAGRGLSIDLTVNPGEVLAVLGPNGAGKSTLLDVVAGLLPPDAGRVRLHGRDLTDVAKGVAVPPHRRRISLLAQDPLLFPHLSVAANVAFGPRSRGVSRRVAAAVARQWLRAVDASDLAGRRPAQLSGGQAQRVALARALAVGPELILLDEPMAALDVTVAVAMRALLRRVLRPADGDHAIEGDTPVRESNAAFRGGDMANPPYGDGRTRRAPTAILVTHDIVDALTLADRVVVLDAGRLVEHGPVGTVLARPRSEFAARIAGVNLLIGTALPVPGAPRSVTSAGPTVVTGPERVEPAVPFTLDRAALDGAAADRAASAPVPGVAGIGAVRCGDDVVSGRCEGVWVAGARAAAVFSPAAVAVYREVPGGSPRNAFRVRIAELSDRGGTVRVHTADRADGSAGLVADLTPGAVAELGLAPGATVYFVVKATEVRVYPC
ncbi:sulfate/molybdate ABC transporter ATP-binding protein [Nocardia sp. alder85J]|uniref:sulfate/molybdate ABC transporter ATP-binding protein n=1 Tax=Nocardia sp. alder85J TaxID=2862949 RepID=UPI001CD7FCF3|nr:ATP-binding cassette domain-containing protein [Nocardia sp. alder85J]MCX4096504.1 ATP-binding cassette domain-containing protein [Nocardia sp. alder85J]